MRRRATTRGLTLIEVMVGMSVLALVFFAAFSHLASLMQRGEMNLDRNFGFERALSILEELRAFGLTEETQHAASLDQFDDGTGFSYSLTIRKKLVAGVPQFVDPAAPDSRNIQRRGVWRFSRRITVRQFAGIERRDLRIVTVRIFINHPETGKPETEIANTSTVIRTIGDSHPSTQVYDVYLVAIENVPGWWVYSDVIKPFMESALGDVAARNPGLQFRTHWITKQGYGRNPQYTPYFNEAAPSTDPIPNVYFYPATMPTGSATDLYYVPEAVQARINVDGEVRNTYDATDNPWPYALADQYNHLMRLPEEEALFNRRVAAGTESDSEPTWRLLLERMISNPDLYRNAILVNLHGELLPLPPLRNYSDAAKEPSLYPGVRVVTHPENLRTEGGRTAPPPDSEADAQQLRDDLQQVADDNPGTPLENHMLDAVHDLDNALTELAKSNPSVTKVVAELDKTEAHVQAAIDAGDLAPLEGSTYIDRIDQIRTDVLTGTPTTAPVGALDVSFRVYTYKTDPATGPERLTAPVIIEIPGLDLTGEVNAATGTTLVIRAISGGLDLDPVDGSRDPYVSPFTVPALVPVVMDNKDYSPSYDGEMYARVYAATPTGGEITTVIELHNSPLVSPVVGAQGLDPSMRLYGMEYIPCSTEAANDFTTTLATDGTVEKNTARWIVTIPTSMLGGWARRVEAVTRIGWGDGGDIDPDGAAFSTGIMYPPESRQQPENISRTYCWWADAVDVVPYTERFQFQGDPRHCPYADLKAGGTSFPNGYNWYFDDMESAGGNGLSRWPGFDATRLKNDGSTDNEGWMGRLEIDLPRFMQLLREGLVASESLYTTLTGWSYYYVGIGNEIGYDAANGFPDSIPVSGQPFGQTGDGFEQSISGTGTYGRGVKYVRSADAGDYWWGIPWLGELYPDSAVSYWRVPKYEYSDTLPLPNPLPAPKGNLPAGSTAGTFYRVPRDQITVRLPYGTALTMKERRCAAEGCTSFMNVGTDAATFHHQGKDGTTGNLTTAGQELALDFRFPLPTAAQISRPFGLDVSSSGGVGDEFYLTADYPRHSVVNRRTYYDHSTGAIGSSLVELSSPDGSSSCFIVVTGLDRTTESGSAFIARFSVLALIHGFMSAGDPALPKPFPMPARIAITGPTAASEIVNPATLDVSWSTEWLRWDGSPYTSAFPGDFSSAESDLRYVLLYSADDGLIWKHMLDGSDATPGTPPAPSLQIEDQNPFDDEVYTWSTPAVSFPKGNYLIRVEAYRLGSRQHFSYHQERIFLNR